MPQATLSPTLRNSLTMGTLSPESLIVSINASVTTLVASQAWPLANMAIYVPIEILYPVTVTRLLVNNGTTVAGNIDVGIFDVNGSRMVSMGSVIQSGTSASQLFDIPDTTLLPGMYYMGLALSNVTGTISGFGGVFVDMAPMGFGQQASAFPLPATISPTTFSGTFAPIITMAIQPTI